jgi:S-DNA-T family DNA segregation ATPase FtsK/SpoIIIE
MATKNSKSKKTTKNKKRSYTTKAQKEAMAQKQLIRDEITLIITFVLSILLLLSNFDLSGKVGQAINRVNFGLFGLIGYLMPIIVFCLVVFLVANRGNKLAYIKTISFIVLISNLASLIQLISVGQDLETLANYYKTSSASKGGGGIIGGLLVNILQPLFGTVGSYVIIIGIIFICLLFLTGKTLFVYLGKKSKRSIQEFKEEHKQARLNQDTPKETKRNSTPRTFLLKDKFKNIRGRKDEADTLVDEALQGLDLGLEQDPLNQTLDNLNANQGQDIFSMEEIKLDKSDEINIPIHRAQFYDEEDGSLDEATINDKVEPAQNLTSPSTDENDDSKEKQARSSKRTSSSEGIEELHLDQSINDEKEYIFPAINLLARPVRKGKFVSDKTLKETALKLQETLESFGVGVTVNNVSCGPSVTRYELQPEQGVKVSKITSLADDIKLNLAASDIRIEAPIPGKAAVGIEVPNKENSLVSLRELLESKDFKEHQSKLSFVVGKDIGGRNIVADIAKMPHLLIAGATGSGKSVCINTIIMSILYNAKPSEVRLIMIDPKVVELSVYNGIPHLLLPVVTDPKKAASALNWAVNEMTIRYKKFADLGVRDLKGYNEKVKNDPSLDEQYEKLTQIVIIVDELADLMMVASSEVEDAICRLAQMARAAGIHLIIATQRPSVNVITGVIKANIPSRIAFSVSSAVDSRTILDSAGAEKLLGKGDMLYYPSGFSKPLRVQGAFVSDKEISKVVDFLNQNNGEAVYDKEVEQEIISTQAQLTSGSSDYMERDEYFAEAGRYIIEKEKASIGMLQRVFRIGFNRAARIMDQLHQAGVVGPEEGTKPRTIIMTLEEFNQYLQDNNIF